MYRSALELFNLTATFSQISDFPLTLQYLESYEKLIDLHGFIDVEEKNRIQSDENIAPILYLQSICDTMSDRDAYVAELMKFIRIDSLGKCLNNSKNIPKRYFLLKIFTFFLKARKLTKKRVNFQFKEI